MQYQKRSSKGRTLLATAGLLAMASSAHADLLYTYSSGELDKFSSYLYGQPDDNYGAASLAGFSFSFLVKENWLSSTPITLTLPVSSASMNEPLFASAPAASAGTNTVTINPDRSISAWNVNFGLAESQPIEPFDPRATIASIFGSGCNCTSFQYNTTLYTERGWGWEELGPAEVTYRGASLAGAWQVTTVSAVPEPETWAMMLGGLALFGGFARRRQRQSMDVIAAR